MSKLSTVIPFEKIESIKIYNNYIRSNGKRLSMAQVQKETGADYIINGTLYNMRSGKAVCPLRGDSYQYCATTDKYWGYAWDMYQPESFHLQIVPDESRPNYIACSCVVKDWQKVEKPIYNSAQGGTRGRTAIGTTVVDGKPALCLWVSADSVIGDRYTPERFARHLYELGWKDGIMLDCGGSSQGYFAGKKLTTFRRCAHYIIIKLKKEGK